MSMRSGSPMTHFNGIYLPIIRLIRNACYMRRIPSFESGRSLLVDIPSFWEFLVNHGRPEARVIGVPLSSNRSIGLSFM